MNYSALIQNRSSVREFSKKKVPDSAVSELKSFYEADCHRLVPELRTELRIFGTEKRGALEGAAGYQDALPGAPGYLVLLSEQGPWYLENAGFLMEDLILKLTDLDLKTCWITYTDSSRVKAALGIDSELSVAAIAAFGYGVKTAKRLRVNKLSMSNVDIQAQRRYFAPKKSVEDLVFLQSWGKTSGVEECIGFYDDLLWESFYACSLAPSYLNRQSYGFLLHGSSGHTVTLVSRDDPYNTEIDGKLSLGAVLLHFTAVASGWTGKLSWTLGADSADLALPEGCTAVATCRV